MHVFVTLLRRELGTFFMSLTGYVIIAAATFLVGESFIVLIKNLGGAASPVPVTELFYRTYFFWLILMLATPVITMRLFAQEKFTGTFETLMTTPVRDFQVVAAKFAAAWMFYLLMWLPMIACCFVIQHFARQSNALEPGTLGGMYMGIALVGALFISIGCFASAITSNQMVAAMVTFAVGVSLFSLAYVADGVSVGADWQSQVIGKFALFHQMQDYARGVVDSRSLIFLASLTLFFLFLTLRAVESRRWK
jgi:ABC-2 type transport system permease protein